MAKITSDRPSPYLSAEQKERLRGLAAVPSAPVLTNPYGPCPVCGKDTLESNYGGERGEAGPFFRCTSHDCDYDQEESPRKTESATEPEQPVARSLPDDWEDMTEAPVNRPIFLTADPATDQGLLCYWRTTREKNQPPLRGWSPKSFWASVLTKREVEFAPACWREAMVQGAVALQAVMA